MWLCLPRYIGILISCPCDPDKSTHSTLPNSSSLLLSSTVHFTIIAQSCFGLKVHIAYYCLKTYLEGWSFQLFGRWLVRQTVPVSTYEGISCQKIFQYSNLTFWIATWYRKVFGLHMCRPSRSLFCAFKGSPNEKMTGGTPEVCSNKNLTLLTFDIWYLTFDILTF